MRRALRLARPFATVAVLALLSAAGGVRLLGAIAYKVTPPVTRPPVYTLAAEPTLVLVERRANPSDAAMDAQEVADEVTRLLRAQVPAVPMVDAGLAIEARTPRKTDGARPLPAEIARACGAAQLIYVDLTRYHASSAVAGEAVAADVEAAVWVVDARTARPRWPAESSQGYALAAGVPFRPAATGGATERAVREETNRALAAKIARLFHSWTEE